MKTHECKICGEQVVIECFDYDECDNNKSSASSAGSTREDAIERLRGQLQNCVNNLDLLKRKIPRSYEKKINSCIESANKALYETMS